ncbi:hypothetical protein CONPUDRAFT_161566 [Coniophora puteana RWD-64-598 SS2]|uniref:Wbp11/ELF5/Saf1 N-terminal domain-containing protein n=1 Tax=Coniophora puteana (strain RWD-64-598) TaxID=741705 RepID=A0A5M3N6J4_CONPW|nr:uncharacterized protein CONPUDRAFT_161566 [Coniophora puteana RWD-64-598 SS2]EIW86936.1 hypothetical protein CONPUDRAFT_161566 [Coniophora puteana RWD-64-598 SS2]
MAKGKSANPADAFRKAQRKKELKKNKTERAKTRDFALVKKDTKELEDDISKLEQSSNSSAADKARLSELKSELDKIMKKKEEYVKEHPEQRRLVYKTRRDEKSEADKEAPTPQKAARNVFNKRGLPRHPERSIYYDPVMNPFGVPPPGMPYVEKDLPPGTSKSDNESDEDEDIVMPEGPPPGGAAEEDSDDDIPMPEGPPPGAASGDILSPYPVPLYARSGKGSVAPPPLPPLPMINGGVPFPPPPPPPGFGAQQPPFIGYPPGPPGAAFYPPPSTLMQPPLPPPPPGFFPRRAQNMSAHQDPLSSVPHQTYQSRQQHRTLPSHHSLPANPMAPSPSATVAAATVSAEPELRDFKKEATAFVPASLKRKKVGQTGPKVNAAPSLGITDVSDVTPAAPRPDLVGTLRTQLGAVPALKGPNKGQSGTDRGKEDYQKFVEEMGDIL